MRGAPGLVLILSTLFAPPSALMGQDMSTIRFEAITTAAGIDFTHNSGASGNRYLPETMGPGAGFMDYNSDGWPDIILVNGTHWPGESGPASTPKLYRNNKNGTFSDVTEAAGLAVEMYGMGVGVADYDNDGDQDLFLSALGQNRLYRNDGAGTFADRTSQAGMLGPEEFSTSVAWSDYDRDGHVDLFVANYIQWSVESDLYCTLDGTRKSYCTPESYGGVSMRLWRNNGDGTFRDATREAGVFDPDSKSLGIAVFDYDQDDWPDIMLVNDTEPNKLYRNRGDGTFEERGMLSGVALSEDGVARAGMGVDTADYDRSGYPSVIIGNFSNQMLALYHNEGNGLFIDEAPRSQLGRRSLPTLSFACLFFDYDLDGWPDILAANGHIEDEIERVQVRIKHAQPLHLFRNRAGQGFEEVTASLGDAFGAPRVARAAAYADIDNDGDLDVLITTNGGRAELFRNDGRIHRSLQIRLVGTRSNRDGLGAKVTVTAGGERQTQTLHSGAGYLSQSELRLTFGLAEHEEAEVVEVRWTSGAVDRLTNVAAGSTVRVEEGQGLVGSEPFGVRD